MNVNEKVNFHQWVYNKARKALCRLSADDALLNHYQELSSEHLRVSTAVVEPNAPCQQNLNLAWFWNVNLGPRDANDNLLTECMLFIPRTIHTLMPPPSLLDSLFTCRHQSLSMEGRRNDHWV
jgi:hypothetical protein